MIFRLESWHINRGQVELALIYPNDSDTFPPAQMPVVKLSVAHVAAGLKGHCPLVASKRRERRERNLSCLATRPH